MRILHPAGYFWAVLSRRPAFSQPGSVDCPDENQENLCITHVLPGRLRSPVVYLSAGGWKDTTGMQERDLVQAGDQLVHNLKMRNSSVCN